MDNRTRGFELGLQLDNAKRAADNPFTPVTIGVLYPNRSEDELEDLDEVDDEEARLDIARCGEGYERLPVRNEGIKKIA